MLLPKSARSQPQNRADQVSSYNSGQILTLGLFKNCSIGVISQGYLYLPPTLWIAGDIRMTSLTRSKARSAARTFITSRGLLSILAVLLLTAPTLYAQTQQINESYTARIREYTTEEFFLTPYVDYLPYSSTVPTPEDVLGHIAGAPDVLSYSHEVHRYMRAVADASPRVKVFTMGESEEGRETILVVVSDEETIANLDHYKELTARLSDPRKISDEEASRVISEAKPIYWVTGALHSGETGSPEMLMELVYRLAVDESPFIKEIRDNLIFMTTPVVEVDGRDKQVDIHMAKRKDPDATVSSRLVYWGKYVAHDNNRDNIGLSLNLSRHVASTYLEYHAQVLHDLHESVAYLYVSTGTGPYNAWIDPILVDEWYEISFAEVSEMTRLGVPGVWTYGFYDGWTPNYMMYAANGHNAIGRFYETQGAGDASTRRISASSTREWYRPNPPLPQVMWSIRNNTNLMQSGVLIAVHHVAVNRVKFLENYYLKGKRSVAKAHNEGPAAYIFPASEIRKGLQADLLNLLVTQGVEIHRAARDFEVGEREYGADSYIIRMDQPFSRMADMLLDRQYFNVNDPRPYDDVGWMLGPLFNIEVVRIEDTSILTAPMRMVEGMITVNGGVRTLTRGRPAAYLINHTADNELATFCFNEADISLEAAEEAFTVNRQDFNAGTFIAGVDGNPAGLEDRLNRAGQEYGFTAFAVSDLPEVQTHEVARPRMALVHTWQSTQTEGWVRIALDSNEIPYDYLSIHDLRDNPNLRDAYDVIMFGPSTSNVMSIIDGLPMTGDPVPWRKSDLTPNIGVQAESDDIRGGLDLEGVIHLRDFIMQGGVLVTITNSSALPIHFGLAQGISIRQTENLWARGGVYRADVSDLRSPITYGYDSELGVYFNGSPVFSGGTGGTGGRFRTGAQGRPSGRGGVDDPDIPQGRARDMGQRSIEEWRRMQQEEREQMEEGSRRQSGQARPRPRTIVQFSRDVDDLLISGGLANGEELAGAPAVVDVPLGDGHVVLFSINPMWRGETHGSYFLVFNALLHFNNLDAGSVSGGR